MRVRVTDGASINPPYSPKDHWNNSSCLDLLEPPYQRPDTVKWEWISRVRSTRSMNGS